MTFRVWLVKGDLKWWVPVTANSREEAVAALPIRQRKLVSRVDEITSWREREAA